MKRIIEPSGKKFNRLTVIKFTHINSDKKICFDCICDCGKKTNVAGKHLRSGAIKSCGCLADETRVSANTTHGDAGRGKKTNEYYIWRSIKDRCLNPKNKNYNQYGGRGISICSRWENSYSKFLIDMGRKPFEKASIDRINNNGNYTPKNCHWVDAKYQANNKRSNRKITYAGKTQSIQCWADETGIAYGTICMRLFRNWTIKKTLTYGKCR